MKGSVDFSDWLHTEMVYPPTDSHLSKYKAGRAQPEIALRTR